jgi:hypothetical protein
MSSNWRKAITTGVVWLVSIALAVFGTSLIGLGAAAALFIACAIGLTLAIWTKLRSQPMTDLPVRPVSWLQPLWIVPMTAAIVGAAFMLQVNRQYNAEMARVIDLTLSIPWVREKFDGTAELQCDTPTKNANGTWAVVVHNNSVPREEYRINISEPKTAP